MFICDLCNLSLLSFSLVSVAKRLVSLVANSGCIDFLCVLLPLTSRWKSSDFSAENGLPMRWRCKGRSVRVVRNGWVIDTLWRQSVVAFWWIQYGVWEKEDSKASARMLACVAGREKEAINWDRKVGRNNGIWGRWAAWFGTFWVCGRRLTSRSRGVSGVEYTVWSPWIWHHPWNFRGWELAAVHREGLLVGFGDLCGSVSERVAKGGWPIGFK